MTTNQFMFLFVVFCGISLHTVLGQLDILNGFSHNNAGVDHPVVQIQEDPGTVEEFAEDPNEDEDDVLTRMGQVESVDEFISLLQLNGRQVTSNDIFDENVDMNGKQVISGGGRLASPDNCSPRNTTIHITMEEETDSDTTFFPRCTKIERCGGCCSSSNLECVARYTERVSLKVLKGRVPFPGATHLEYTGFASVIVDRHMTCRINCKLNAESCGPKKQFYRRKCMCKCKTVTPCVVPTIWDEDDCSCKCPFVTECCREGENCGMVWNPSTCECVLANDGRMTISAGGNSNNLTVHNANPAPNPTPEPTPSTTSTTTTTTTTPTTTPFDPCRTRMCPRGFTKVPNGNNCQCRPPMRFGSRGRSRSRSRG